MQANRAPRPAARSYTRSVYDALMSCEGGIATLNQIRTLIPATDDADKWTNKQLSYKALHERMISIAYHGYIKRLDDTGPHKNRRYRLSTEDEYLAAKAHYNSQPSKKPKPSPKRAERKESKTDLEQQAVQKWTRAQKLHERRMNEIYFMLIVAGGVAAGGIVGALITLAIGGNL